MNSFRKWISLFGTQFFGVLNDNYLKNLIVFISVMWMGAGSQTTVITIASTALVLPFLIFSPLAARLSLTYKKQRIVELAKLAEIPIMMISIIGFYYENFYVVIASLFLMGIQSALYSPAKYGLIKDIGGIQGVSYGSGMMELLTFVAVLLGTLLAGVTSDIVGYKKESLAAILIGFALIGWLFSKRIKAEEELDVKGEKESVIPLVFVFELFKWSKSIKGLNFTVLGLASFWMIASLLQMTVIAHLPVVYGLNSTTTSMVMGALAIGIGLGCYVAGVISKGRVEIGMVPLGGIGMTVCLVLLGFTDLQFHNFVIVLVISAFFSGFFKVPLNAWIQERVPSEFLGKVLAYNNNVVFLFILLSAGIFQLVAVYVDTYAVLQVTCIISCIITLVVLLRIPSMLVRFMFFMTASLLYKIRVQGFDKLKNVKGALLIVNHISLLDAFVIVASVPRNVRFVMLKEIYESPWFNWLFKRVNMIPVPGDKTPEALEEFNKICQDEINAGHVVCIFPEGQLSRNGHVQGFKKGIEHIARGINAPIIPMHMEGLNHSSLTFGLGTGKVIMPKFKLKRHEVNVNIGEPRNDKPGAFEMRLSIQKLQSETINRKLNRGDLSKVKLLRESLREVLFMRSNIDVLNLLPAGNLSFGIEKSLGEHLNFVKKKTPNTRTVLIKNKDLIDVSLFEGVEKVFVQGCIKDEVRTQIQELGSQVYESLVLESGEIISVNTPNVSSSDVNGKKMSQFGSKEGTLGRALPGVAIKLLTEGGSLVLMPNEEGYLWVNPVGHTSEEWVDSKERASIDEDGFITIK